jgi:hypothetical protein
MPARERQDGTKEQEQEIGACRRILLTPLEFSREPGFALRQFAEAIDIAALYHPCLGVEPGSRELLILD